MEDNRIFRNFAFYNERLALQTPGEAVSVKADGKEIYNPWSKDGRSLSDGEAVETYGLTAVVSFMEEAEYDISRHERGFLEKIEAALHKDGADMEACEDAVAEYREESGGEDFFACSWMSKA